MRRKLAMHARSMKGETKEWQENKQCIVSCAHFAFILFVHSTEGGVTDYIKLAPCHSCWEFLCFLVWIASSTEKNESWSLNYHWVPVNMIIPHKQGHKHWLYLSLLPFNILPNWSLISSLCHPHMRHHNHHTFTLYTTHQTQTCLTKASKSFRCDTMHLLLRLGMN